MLESKKHFHIIISINIIYLIMLVLGGNVIWHIILRFTH